MVQRTVILLALCAGLLAQVPLPPGGGGAGGTISSGTADTIACYSTATNITSCGDATDGFIWNPSLISATLRNDGIGSTATAGFVLRNQTAAAAGAQQMSPALEFEGQGWKTAATAASQTVKWRVDLLPVEGVANPSSELRFSRDINAGGFANKIRVFSSGRHVWEMDANIRNTARIQTNLGSVSAFSGENYNAGWPFAFQGRGSRGSAAAPAVTQSGDWLAVFEGMGRTVAAVDDGDSGFNNFGGAGAGFLVIATELHSPTAEGKRMTFFTTPNGATIEKVFMVADQNGDVRIGKSQGNGFGTFDVLPAADLHIYDRTATTGSTEFRVQGGVGQGTNVLTQWTNNTGTQLASVGSTGGITGTLYSTITNCSSSAAPAVCAAAAAGSVVIAAAATTVTVNTTAVTADSQILLMYDSGLGTKLSVTCNTTQPTLFGVTARTAATSFVITATAPVTNPACFSYLVVN